MTYYKDKWNRTESSEMNLFNVDNWFDKDIKTNSVKGESEKMENCICTLENISLKKLKRIHQYPKKINFKK